MSLSGSYRLGFELRGTTNSVTATVNDVLADSPAEAAGVQAGDRIVAINGKQVDGESIRPTIQDSRGAPVTRDRRAQREDGASSSRSGPRSPRSSASSARSASRSR